MSEQLALCIGAPRSGTTWLYDHLRLTDEVFAPPIKEVRHFLSCPTPAQRKDAAERRRARDLVLEDLRWLEGWEALRPKEDEAYLALMTGASDKPVAIDISPSYCVADRPTVKRAKRVLPASTRIIMMLRDPVEREYSQANLKFHKGGGLAESRSLEDYLTFLDQPHQRRRSDYATVIDLWSQHFEHVHAIFFDDLVAAPDRVLEEVTAFLGLRSPIPQEQRRKSFNSSHRPGMAKAPESLKRALSIRDLPQLEAFAERFPGYGPGWLAKARERIG